MEDQKEIEELADLIYAIQDNKLSGPQGAKLLLGRGYRKQAPESKLVPPITYQQGYSDGYKEGFNKACDPVIRAKMLENNPIICAPSLPSVEEIKDAIYKLEFDGSLSQHDFNDIAQAIHRLLEKGRA